MLKIFSLKIICFGQWTHLETNIAPIGPIREGKDSLPVFIFSTRELNSKHTEVSTESLWSSYSTHHETRYDSRSISKARR